MQEMEEALDDLLSSYECSETFEDYFEEHLWLCRHAWCKAYQVTLPTRGNST